MADSWHDVRFELADLIVRLLAAKGSQAMPVRSTIDCRGTVAMVLQCSVSYKRAP